MEIIYPKDFFTNNLIKTTIQYAKIHGSLNFTNDLIIPPTWNKTNNPKINSAWKLAYSLLKEANQIIIIGYSLPITDSYIKYLLVNSINDNDNLKRIIIINPDDEQKQVQKRYETFFDKNLIESKIIKFIPEKFEDWVYSGMKL